jgi:hypothetical protein
LSLMSANSNGSGWSRGSAGAGSFLALIHAVFGSSFDPGHFIYSHNHESRRRLTLKINRALVQGAKARLRRRRSSFNN